MKVSVNLLKQLGDIEQTNADIVRVIKEHIGEVESVQDMASDYEGIIVAKIVEKGDHTNADKLGVYKLDIATEESIQVLAGDKTLEVGDKVAYLKPGSKVPYTIYTEEKPIIIEAKEMRGIMSNGMMGSERELNLGPDHTIVMKLPQDAPVGQSFAQYYGLDDYIIEIENKALTNRGDLFSILGLARELTVILGKTFNTPDWYKDTSLVLTPQSNCLALNIANDAEVLCPRYTAIVIDNINIAQSPLWLKSALLRLGYKPINNIVDITNYIAHISGQPLHAFDYDKIVSKDPNSNGIANINIRMATQAESILGLDDKVHVLNDRVMVIADNTNPIAIAGIMGGAETEVDENTKRIVLESANFDKTTVRKTSMLLGLQTEAGTKFKHALTPEQCLPVLKEATKMIVELANGSIASEIIDIHPSPKTLNPISFSISNLATVTGLDLNKEVILRILTNLEYEILEDSGDNLVVKAPTWREDISIKEDVFEDVARIYGYNNIEPVLPTRDLVPSKGNAIYELKRSIRQLLADRGCNETDTYSFTNVQTIKNAGMNPERAYILKNPLAPELALMRTSLIPTLLSKVQYNYQEGFEKMALFEMNLSHQKDYTDNDGLSVEDWHLSMILSSSEKREDSAYYQAKYYADQVLGLAKITPNYVLVADYSEDDIPNNMKDILYIFDPNTSALILCEGEILGIVGEIDNRVKSNFKLPQYTAGIDINLNKLINYHNNTKILNKVSKYPESRVDLCFEVEQDTKYASIFDTIYQTINNDQLIGNVSCIDIYKENEESTKKKITFRIAIRSTERTLSEKDIKEVVESIKKSVEENTGGLLI